MVATETKDCLKESFLNHLGIYFATEPKRDNVIGAWIIDNDQMIEFEIIYAAVCSFADEKGRRVKEVSAGRDVLIFVVSDLKGRIRVNITFGQCPIEIRIW